MLRPDVLLRFPLCPIYGHKSQALLIFMGIQWAETEGGLDAEGESFSKIGDLIFSPGDNAVLAGVEVNFFIGDFILATGPDYGFTEAHSETGFEVGPGVLAGEIGHDETGFAYFSDDLIINPVAVFLAVNPQRQVTGGAYARLDAIMPERVEFRIEGHCDEPLIGLVGTYPCEIYPPFRGDAVIPRFRPYIRGGLGFRQAVVVSSTQANI